MNTQFTVQKGTLDGTPTQIDPNSLFVVDFTKIQSVNDLVLILASMGISFPATHPHFEQVKQFLNLDNPIHLNQERPAERKEMSLPKLKKVK
jgi:hypothetical protein